MSIDFTWTSMEWTEADSDALDAAIIAERAKRGLCLSCQRPMYSRWGNHTFGTVRLGGHGRCEACYKRAIRRGEL